MKPAAVPTLICPYEVPVETDEEFVAVWSGAGEATLLRALRQDVDFRFVEMAPSAREPAGGFASHPGMYEAVRVDGHPDVEGGVFLVNPFEVPDGDDERFLAGWERAREVLAGRQGYIGTRLHRSVEPADFRFVNVARWSSPLMFARALDDERFREAAGAIPFRSHPALYQPAPTSS